MSSTALPANRRRALLRDIEAQLERLGMQLALARGRRARERLLSEIDEVQRRRALLQSTI